MPLSSQEEEKASQVDSRVESMQIELEQLRRCIEVTRPDGAGGRSIGHEQSAQQRFRATLLLVRTITMG